MGKKSWASSEQQEWLYSQLPGFAKAQEDKMTSDFFSKVYTDFYNQWPVPSPISAEIAAADGGEEQAITRKEKASEAVSYAWFDYIYIN